MEDLNYIKYINSPTHQASLNEMKLCCFNILELPEKPDNKD